MAINQLSQSNTFQQWLISTTQLIALANSLTDGGANGTFIVNTNLSIANNLTVNGNITSTKLIASNANINSLNVNTITFFDGEILYSSTVPNLNAFLISTSSHSNSAFDKANSSNVLAQSAFDKANSANVLAQAAFDRANSVDGITVVENLSSTTLYPVMVGVAGVSVTPNVTTNRFTFNATNGTTQIQGLMRSWGSAAGYGLGDRAAAIQTNRYEIYSQDNKFHVFDNIVSVNRLTVSSANVGIGTSTPTSALDINGTLTISGLGRKIIGNWGNATALVDRPAFVPSAVNSGIGIVVAPTGTGGQSDINLFAGSDVGNSAFLSLSSYASGSLCRILAEKTGTGIYYPLAFSAGGTERVRITTTGEVYIAGITDQGAYNLQCNGTGVWGAGAYVNGSDARIKEDVVPITSGLDVVANLNPVQFRYKSEWSSDQNIQPGFIAQELQTALTGKDYAQGVVMQGPEYMSVAYQTLIPILTKAIQEQQVQIDQLKAEIADIRGD